MEGGGRIVDELGGQKRHQNKLFCGKCGPQIFTRGPQRNVPGPGTFTSGPHFFMSGPHFFTRRPQRNVPGPGTFTSGPQRKMIMPEIKGSTLFSLHPPPETTPPSPLTLHHSPFTTHQNPVQVVQHISIAHFRLFSLVFFCFLLFLKARFSGPMASGCLSQSGMRKFTTSCSTVMVKGPSSWRSRRPSTPTSAWRASSTSMWRVR